MIRLPTSIPKNQMSLGGIYQIRNVINNKVYLGSTRNFYNRRKEHNSLLVNKCHHSYILQRAINKYGIDNFIFEIVSIINDLDTLLDVEQEYLDQLKPYKYGYNVSNMAASGQGPAIRAAQSKTKIKQHAEKKRSQEELISLAKKQFNIEEIPPNTKIIDAGRKCILVDEANYSELSRYNWFYGTDGLATRVGNMANNNQNKYYKIHRHIIGPTKRFVKFKNGCKQDCRRSNLYIKLPRGPEWIAPPVEHTIYSIVVNDKIIYVGSSREPAIKANIKHVQEKNNELQEILKDNKWTYEIIFRSKDKLECDKIKKEKMLEIGIENLCNKQLPGEAISKSKTAREKISKFRTKYNIEHHVCVGESNCGSKLKEEQVILIRDAFKNGTTTTELAKQYSVTICCIQELIRRKTWAHI